MGRLPRQRHRASHPLLHRGEVQGEFEEPGRDLSQIAGRVNDMNKLRIFVDFTGTVESLDLLRAETVGHELLFAKAPGGSVLAGSGADPQLPMADIAFGQPNPNGVETAPHLKWIHVSSSGIARYDNAEFRAFVGS